MTWRRTDDKPLPEKMFSDSFIIYIARFLWVKCILFLSSLTTCTTGPTQSPSYKVSIHCQGNSPYLPSSMSNPMKRRGTVARRRLRWRMKRFLKEEVREAILMASQWWHIWCHITWVLAFQITNRLNICSTPCSSYEYLFTSLFKLTTKKHELSHHCPFVRESTSDWWIPLTKGQ